jgi:hypothetical protein
MVVFGRQGGEENERGLYKQRGNQRRATQSSEYLHLQRLVISVAMNGSLLQRTRF